MRAENDMRDFQAPGGHVPVMLDRVLELLAPSLAGPDPVAVDANLGLGGHAEALLAAHPALHLIGIDRDPTAIERSTSRLAPYADRITLVRAVSDELTEVLAEAGRPRVNAVLFDLGSPRPSSTRPSAASPTPTRPRWTCGWTATRS